MYRFLIRPLLFLVDPETIHRITFEGLKIACRIPGFRILLRLIYQVNDPALSVRLMGLTFPNPVGLAAGFDKNAREVDELACFGFGFIEIGTVTPVAQEGNEKPRLFRVPADHALINRMGFNNDGVIVAAERLGRRRSKVLIGGNIGKNKVTPNARAFEDYNYCFESLYPCVDYFVVNVSSPNTPNLRELQEKEPLKKLLTQVKELSKQKPVARPILLKIAPDLTEGQLNDIIQIVRETGTDGIIATNTTIARGALTTDASEIEKMGAGGLSGAPLRKRSTEIIAYLRNALGPSYPIIGVGGIMSVDDALEKLEAGANLIQLYTGFIYEGPAFPRKILRGLKERHKTRVVQ